MQERNHNGSNTPPNDPRKDFRVRIFKENLALFRQGYYEDKETGRCYFKEVRTLMDDSYLYDDEFELEDYPPVEGGTIYEVLPFDCIEVAERLVGEGQDTILLNMASRTYPGGGVETGAGAQEEQLCRRSNLVMSLFRFSERKLREHPEMELSLQEGRYPLDEQFGGVYSPEVTFFRNSEKELYSLKDNPFRCAVVSVAGIPHPKLNPSGHLFDKDRRTTMNKMRTILRIGLENGHTAIVLGALGCGAFGNPPEDIAQLWREVLLEPEFKDQFEKVVFAILDDANARRNSSEGNYLPFKRTFKDLVKDSRNEK